MRIARRSFLAAASLAATPIPAWAQGFSAGMFTHGVASGDPLPTNVVLWTRFVHSGDGRIGWEVSEDENFARVARRGEATSSIVNDFCVKVEANGLRAGRRYFYRFLSASGPSPTGRTLTAPRVGVDHLTIALFSCSNMPFGYFHAYGHAAARDDIDLVVHAGDYIYEVPRGLYPSAREAVPGRVIDPVNEIVTLSDYYQRYASYHSDADLLELRRLKPLCVVWDDHELVNNTWREGAQDHDPATEGDFSARIAAASKAYFDWLPIRRPTAAGARITRTLDWGDLARLLLIDTRFIGRDQQLDYRPIAAALAQGGAAARAAAAPIRTALNDPNRTIMGQEQERWFANALTESKARGHVWQIVAQQVVMGPQMMPQAASAMLPSTASEGARTWIGGGEALGAMGMPWNLDAWDGYPAARARFLAACAANANNTVVLGGDSHNCWLNNLPTEGGGRLAAIEFAGGSVTSPGFERSLTAAAPGQRERALKSANPNLAWCDVSSRGYGVLQFQRTHLFAYWHAFDDVRDPEPGAPRVSRIAAAASIAGGPGPWTAP